MTASGAPAAAPLADRGGSPRATPAGNKSSTTGIKNAQEDRRNRLSMPYQPMALGSQVAIWGKLNNATSAISCNTTKGVTPT